MDRASQKMVHNKSSLQYTTEKTFLLRIIVFYVDYTVHNIH